MLIPSCDRYQAIVELAFGPDADQRVYAAEIVGAEKDVHRLGLVGVVDDGEFHVVHDWVVAPEEQVAPAADRIDNVEGIVFECLVV